MLDCKPGKQSDCNSLTGYCSCNSRMWEGEAAPVPGCGREGQLQFQTVEGVGNCNSRLWDGGQLQFQDVGGGGSCSRIMSFLD